MIVIMYSTTSNISFSFQTSLNTAVGLLLTFKSKEVTDKMKL